MSTFQENKIKTVSEVLNFDNFVQIILEANFGESFVRSFARLFFFKYFISFLKVLTAASDGDQKAEVANKLIFQIKR